MPHVLLVAGTRPNFMKVAPIRRALDASGVPVRLLHTGQHFDASMSDVFFRDLGMPPPEVSLHVGGGSHAEQTAAVLVGVERELLRDRPSCVVVVGDVTSTLAAALAAVKLGVPVVHVEAGLRSRDWTMPEEVNRILTDRMSDLLLVPSEDARTNLLDERLESERIAFVGNVMIDSLHQALTQPSDVHARLGVSPRAYAVATMHRPVNVDSDDALARTLAALSVVARRLPVVFPVHPRTRARLAAGGHAERLRAAGDLRLVEPVGYVDFTRLLRDAALVATDSGGIQEETTALGVPCLTLRESTERPITVTEGTNTIVDLDAARIAAETDAILAGGGKRGRVPVGWDGRAGERIAGAIVRLLAGEPPARAARAGAG